MPNPISTKLFGFVTLLLSKLVLLANSSSVIADQRVQFLQQDSQPKYFLESQDETGAGCYGLCGDLYRSLIARLNEQNITAVVDGRYLPIKRILKQVETSSADVFCGAGRNADREKRFIYSKYPVYGISNVVAAHQDDSYNPGSYEELKLRSDKIAALYGTSSARFLKDEWGINPNDHFLDIDSALKAVANRNVRYFYYHDLGLNYLVPASKLPLRVVPSKLRTTPQWMIYSKTMSPELVQILDGLLKEMTDSGELEKIQKKYL